MNAEEIPDQIKALVDERAGKVHSNAGSVMTTLAEALTVYEKELRAKIAYDIRADLVCCEEYERVVSTDKALNEKGDRLWYPEKMFPDYHAICHWGECAARIAEGQPELLPVGLCSDKADHEPHEHDSKTLGKFWCTGDQHNRLPHAAEVRRINSG